MGLKKILAFFRRQMQRTSFQVMLGCVSLMSLIVLLGDPPLNIVVGWMVFYVHQIPELLALFSFGFWFHEIKMPFKACLVVYFLSEGFREFDFTRENPLFWMVLEFEQIVEDLRPLILDFNLYSIRIFLRSLRCRLSPHWFCDGCGRQLRYSFKVLADSFTDPLLDEKAGWRAAPKIRCVLCFQLLQEESNS